MPAIALPILTQSASEIPATGQDKATAIMQQLQSNILKDVEAIHSSCLGESGLKRFCKSMSHVFAR
jgi:hypothetical protein